MEEKSKLELIQEGLDNRKIEEKRIKEEKKKKKNESTLSIKLKSNPSVDLSQCQNTLIEEEIDKDTGEIIKKIIPILDIIKDYNIPKLNLPDITTKKGSALTQAKRQIGKALWFINRIKHVRSKDYCTILILSCKSSLYLNAWGSAQTVSNTIDSFCKYGLLEELTENIDNATSNYSFKYGYAKRYKYYVEIEKEIVEFCKNNNIDEYPKTNQDGFGEDNLKRLEKSKATNRTKLDPKKVVFGKGLHIKKPDGIGVESFNKILDDQLMVNYPEYRIFKRIISNINEKFYTDDRLKLKLQAHFDWNKDKTMVTGIGIRATNKLCGAVKSVEKLTDKKKILREDVLKEFGLNFECDITSSIARITIALNRGIWLDNKVDIYEMIFKEYDPYGNFTSEIRNIIKGLFFRTYFDGTDNQMAFRTFNKTFNCKLSKSEVAEEMIKLRQAMLDVLGYKTYGNYIFLVESCIYADALRLLLEKGYFVWEVYDCFYGRGFGSEDEFRDYVLTAVYICFMNFKFAKDFRDWEEMYKHKYD